MPYVPPVCPLEITNDFFWINMVCIWLISFSAFFVSDSLTEISGEKLNNLGNLRFQKTGGECPKVSNLCFEKSILRTF